MIKKALITAIISCLLFVQPVYASNSDDIINEADFVLTMQKSSGAFGLTPDSEHLNPYYANLTAQVLPALGEPYAIATKNYMEWYFSKMNKVPDELGIRGTIYDYIVTVDDAGETVELPEYVVDSTKKIYDSSDSYAATFLSLANAYHEATSDDRYIRRHFKELFMVVRAMEATMQSNWLTWAKADYPVAYMMDNTEVWRGYMDFAALLDRMGYRLASKFYERRASMVAAAIEKYLWDEENQGYRPYQGHDMDWEVYYPDGRANMRAIMFELPMAMKRKEVLFESFISNNPEWITNEAGASPNVATAVAGIKAGDIEAVLAFLTKTCFKFEDRAWPWKISESGYYIRVLTLLK